MKFVVGMSAQNDMHKSSVLEIIRTFSKPDIIKFEDFIKSPYYNKKENVIKLFLVIKKYAPDFTSGNLEKQKVWNSLFPGVRYNYGIMKNIIFDLNRLAEVFITQESVKEDKLKNNIELMAALFYRQLSKIASLKYDSAKKSYDKKEFKNEDFKIFDYYTEMSKINYFKAVYNRFYAPKLSSSELFITSLEYYIYSVTIGFYKHYNNYLAFKDSGVDDKDSITEAFLTSINENFIGYLLNKVKDKSERDYKILKCFHDMNLSQKHDATREDYFNFKNSIEDCVNIFSKGDLQDLLCCLYNSLDYISKRESGADFNPVREKLDIFDMEIANNLFLFKGVMDENNFISYVNTAFALGEYEKIEKLRSRFINKIPKDRRENVNLYSLANISFGNKSFDESLRLLSMINHDYFNMKYFLKDMQIMIYFEINDYLSFSYALDSYRHFLSKNKSVQKQNKSQSEAFCNHVGKLFKFRESNDIYEIENFRKEIKADRNIHKFWILDKIKEIENPKN